MPTTGQGGCLQLLCLINQQQSAGRIIPAKCVTMARFCDWPGKAPRVDESGGKSWRHDGCSISATIWRYSSTASLGEINICQQRLQLPYIPNVRLLARRRLRKRQTKEGGVAMASLRIAFFALALLGSSMVVGQASAAMPVNGLTEASKQISSVDKVWYWTLAHGAGAGVTGDGAAVLWGHPDWGRPYWGRPYWGRPYVYGWRGGCGWRRCWW